MCVFVAIMQLYFILSENLHVDFVESPDEVLLRFCIFELSHFFASDTIKGHRQ